MTSCESNGTCEIIRVSRIIYNLYIILGNYPEILKSLKDES